MRSITLKLTLAFLLVGLVGAVLVAVLTRQRTRAAFDVFLFDREKQTLADNLVRFYQNTGSWEGVANVLPFQIEAPAANQGERGFPPGLNGFTLVGPDQTIVFGGQQGRNHGTLSDRNLDDAIPLVSNGVTVGWLMVAPMPRALNRNSSEQLFLRSINQAIILSALVASGLALILGGLLAYTMTRSLRDLTEATVEIAKGRFGNQVKVRTKDEFGELARAFNKMSLDLERATQARRQMTADIAHDLRSPLTVISGYAEALNDEKLPGTTEIYGILYQETKHLSRLVEDLRTLSLADAGELPLVKTNIKPQALIEQVATRHVVAAQQNGIALRVESGEDLPDLSVDVERLTQVFDNLVLNAFRYTPTGGEVVLKAAEAISEAIEFQVRDSGTGIASEDLPFVFDRFYKGDKSRHENGESGLGLAIAKSIVELHRGTIAVTSSLGEGTTFTIILPLV